MGEGEEEEEIPGANLLEVKVDRERIIVVPHEKLRHEVEQVVLSSLDSRLLLTHHTEDHWLAL